jgi:protein involved in polysaccharide export with SLBB domain
MMRLSALRWRDRCRLGVVGVLLTAVALLAVAPVASALPAQLPGQKATRAEVEAHLQKLRTALPTLKSAGQRRNTQMDIAALEERLSVGDFKLGDRFVITVVWDETFSDTATVREGYLVSIRGLPDATVQGVLRAELVDHLTAHVSRYLKNVQVRVNVFHRISVLGEVRSIGFFLVAPDRPISELIMAAGGPTQLSKLDQLEVRRNGRVVLTAKQSRQALREGRTIEELDIRSGDEVTIPRKRRINWQIVLRIMLLASSLFFAVVRFLAWYYREE